MTRATLIEAMARATYVHAIGPHFSDEWDDLNEKLRARYRYDATAALDALHAALTEGGCRVVSVEATAHAVVMEINPNATEWDFRAVQAARVAIAAAPSPFAPDEVGKGDTPHG